MLCCSPTDWADIYYTVYNFELYVFPLAIIVATHLKIYLLLKRYVSLTVYKKARKAFYRRQNLSLHMISKSVIFLLAERPLICAYVYLQFCIFVSRPIN